jgi:hypothetical protein
MHDDLTDFFAGLAMLAVISKKDFEFEDNTWETIYDIADAMMKERERRKKDDSV